MSYRAYLSLGSNTGDRAQNLESAIARLREHEHVVAVSSFYETEPVENTRQPWFLNCAVALDTVKTPAQLIGSLLELERRMGRTRDGRKGPRNIDLDILLYEDRVIASEDLTIPHPVMTGRRFVLEPLAEIAGDVRHPLAGKTIRELLADLPSGAEVRRFAGDGA